VPGRTKRIGAYAEGQARVDPEVRHRRAVAGARARTGPDYHLDKLAALLGSLTAGQQRRLAALGLAALVPAPDGVRDDPTSAR
jgi:hypothetical protein